MPSQPLLKKIDHLTDVRHHLAAAGFAPAGCEVAQLTRQELREQEVAFKSGVSAQDLAAAFITRRTEQLATCVADGYVESDENGLARAVSAARAA